MFRSAVIQCQHLSSKPRRETPGPPIRYITINDFPTLGWAASYAALELHTFLHRAVHLNRPTSMVFDCDPGEGADILACARVAALLHDTLKELGFQSRRRVGTDDADDE